MIAKRVQRTQGTSSTAGLVRYIVGAQGELDPRSWARTAEYILAMRPERAGGERVASFRVTNCGTDDPSDAALIIEAIQAANTRSKSDKTYHLLFSFPPGETPALEVLHAIEDELCAAIGYAEHQRISAVHVQHRPPACACGDQQGSPQRPAKHRAVLRQTPAHEGLRAHRGAVRPAAHPSRTTRGDRP